MSRKIFIELAGYRDCNNISDCDEPKSEGYIPPVNGSITAIREMAVFSVTCRRCEDAPCIAVCPEDALGKNEDGIVTRAKNLCISCKSCVMACPFGTLMTDFFQYKKSLDTYFDITDDTELKKLVESSPVGTVKLVDMDENREENVYKIHEKVLVRDFKWHTNE